MDIGTSGDPLFDLYRDGYWKYQKRAEYWFMMAMMEAGLILVLLAMAWRLL